MYIKYKPSERYKYRNVFCNTTITGVNLIQGDKNLINVEETVRRVQDRFSERSRGRPLVTRDAARGTETVKSDAIFSNLVCKLVFHLVYFLIYVHKYEYS